MSNNNGSAPSSKDDDLKKLGLSDYWIDLFKLKDANSEWSKLFIENDPDGKWKNLLTNRNPDLGRLIAQHHELAEHFLKCAAWEDIFSNNKESTKFLTNNQEDLEWLKVFLPYPDWAEIFQAYSKELTKNISDDQKWGKSLNNNHEWKALFASKPEWVKVFLRKPEYFDFFAENIEWAKKLACAKKPDDDKWWDDTFKEYPEWAIVFAYELSQINKKRNLGENCIKSDDLIGLAFSGGGIRSASFGLGVLEALRDFGLLRKIDYLSTVSGGGYIGAWLSANCYRANENGINDWLAPRKKEQDNNNDEKISKDPWKDSIDYLRRYSNYLSPKVGLFSADTWTMLAVWLRNTLLIQLMVIVGIATLLLIPRLLFFLFNWWPDAGYFIYKPLNFRWITVLLFILGVTGIAWNSRRLTLSKMKLVGWEVDSELICGLFGFLICLGISFFIKSKYNDLFYLFDINTSEKLIAHSVIAFLLVLAGFFLFSLLIQYKRSINQKTIPIDYSEGRVQALVVLPMMLVSFFVAAILWNQSQTFPICSISSYSEYFKRGWEYLPFELIVVFMSMILLAFSCGNEIDKKEDLHLRIWHSYIIPIGSFLISIGFLYAFISAIMLLLHDWILLGDEGKWRAFVWSPSLILVVFALSIVMLLGMLGNRTTEAVREWWSRLGAWLAICGFSWIAIAAMAVYGPLWSARLHYENFGWAFGSGWIGTTLAGLFAGNSANTSGMNGKGVSGKINEVIAKGAPFVFIAGLLIAVSMVVHLVIAFNSNPAFQISQENLLGNFDQPSKQLVMQIDAKSDVHIDLSTTQAKIQEDNNEQIYPAHWHLLSSAKLCEMGWIFAICLVCVILLSYRVDINEFSFNAFYRSRLARCYLGATRRKSERNPQNFTGFDDADDFELSKLKESPGPIHIVNCALNLGGSSDLSLHTRHSAIFTLTPFFCGSRYKIKSIDSLEEPEIGYIPTERYGGEYNQPKLGQAIAVSGAAANPNMGYHTSPVTAFLMTLFNVRLGWWFPSPRTKADTPSPRFSLYYLFRELFGAANEKPDFLSISDGGHFENLAAYELVKRRCKVIIISDGGCDPHYQFEDLGNLIRICEVDFGTKINIDVQSMIPDAGAPWSRNRCAVGEIIYDENNNENNNENNGVLIYIKAAMNGHENTAVMQYKSTHTNFPHETTGDQFYSENQFESYRSLGRDITERTFEAIAKDINPKTSSSTDSAAKEPNIIEYLEKLKKIWSPTLPNVGSFSHHTDRLMEFWSELNEDNKLKKLDKQLTKAWPSSEDEHFRSEFYFCSQLIQLMENVYLDLNLDETWAHLDNKGWRTLFEQWAKSDALKKTWEMTDKNYGLRFRYFCERHLKLPLSKESTT